MDATTPVLMALVAVCMFLGERCSGLAKRVEQLEHAVRSLDERDDDTVRDLVFLWNWRRRLSAWLAQRFKFTHWRLTDLEYLRGPFNCGCVMPELDGGNSRDAGSQVAAATQEETNNVK